MGGRVGETGRSRGMVNCYQDTECDKQPLLSVKGWRKKRKRLVKSHTMVLAEMKDSEVR